VAIEFLPISAQLLLGKIAKEDFGENKKITIFYFYPNLYNNSV
jgi:hypothetical protein